MTLTLSQKIDNPYILSLHYIDSVAGLDGKLGQIGSPYCVSLNLNNCVQGCLMPNFRVLASILTDIFNFLTKKGRKGERKGEREKGSK